MGAEYRGIEVDHDKLLKLLCQMANMEHAGVRKAVLVCEVGAPPRLFVESYLQPVGQQSADALLAAGLGIYVEAVEGILVDVTTMQRDSQ